MTHQDADNRYYSNAYGRFMTPDPYTNSGRLRDPQSWNRYAYTRGDPVNRFDPKGTDDGIPYECFIDPEGMYDPACAAANCAAYGFVDVSCDNNGWGPIVTFQQPGGGGGGGQANDPLQCFFTGATFPEPGWGTTDNNENLGYYVPAELTFQAVGGDGSYSWSDQQITLHSGTVTYSSGKSVDTSRFPAIHESLGTTSTPGSTATFFDAPGIQGCTGLGCITSANLTWTFILSVQVSSAGQTVDCPTVVWQVQETWTGFMIGNDPVQWVTGGGTVLSP